MTYVVIYCLLIYPVYRGFLKISTDYALSEENEEVATEKELASCVRGSRVAAAIWPIAIFLVLWFIASRRLSGQE